MKTDNKLYKTIFLFFIFIFFVGISSFASINEIFSASLADSNDMFEVINPSANTNLKGTTNIEIKAYDDDRANIPFSIGLYDPHTCSNYFYGNINTNSKISSNSSSTTLISWDTKKTISDSSIQDGDYCLKVCLVLKNGDNNYTACNARSVRLINYNKVPVITSFPSKLQYIEGESFNYQMTANDPDGDDIIYRFITTPGFLNINPLTGLITSNPLSTYGNGYISYTVTVGVDDGINPTVNQTFTFTVNKVSTPTPGKDGGSSENPQPQNPDSSEENEEDEETDEPVEKPEESNDLDIQISFISPTQGEVINSLKKLVKWEIDETDEIKNLILEYSSDSKVWFELKTNINPNQNYYIWDVSNLQDNDYFLRLVALGKEDQRVEQVSQRFSINTYEQDDENEEENFESSPLIINLSPGNEEEIKEENPTISGDFIPSEESQIVLKTFVINLDGQSIIDLCTTDQNQFVCSIDFDLNEGKHSVSASIEDSTGQVATAEWSFNVNYPDITSSSNSDNSESSGFLGSINKTFLIILIILIILLLVIPWIIYVIWKGREEEGNSTKKTVVITAPPFSDTYTAFPETNVTINQPVSKESNKPLPIYEPLTPEELNQPINNYNGNYVIPYPIQPKPSDTSINNNNETDMGEDTNKNTSIINKSENPNNNSLEANTKEEAKNETSKDTKIEDTSLNNSDTNVDSTSTTSTNENTEETSEDDEFVEPLQTS